MVHHSMTGRQRGCGWLLCPDLGDLCKSNGSNDPFWCVEDILSAITAANVGADGSPGKVCFAQGTSVTGTSTAGFAAALDCAKVRGVVSMRCVSCLSVPALCS